MRGPARKARGVNIQSIIHSFMMSELCGLLACLHLLSPQPRGAAARNFDVEKCVMMTTICVACLLACLHLPPLQPRGATARMFDVDPAHLGDYDLHGLRACLHSLSLQPRGAAARTFNVEMPRYDGFCDFVCIPSRCSSEARRLASSILSEACPEQQGITL